jgi:hypothetical protein
MKRLKDPADLGLAKVGPKKFNCYWPVKKIHNMSGISVETQKQLLGKKYVDETFRIKPGIELYAKVDGTDDGKWYLFNLPNLKSSARVVPFNDPIERKKIEKVLNKKSNSKDKMLLSGAMQLAEEMLQRCLESTSNDSEMPIETDMNDEAVPVSARPRNVPMPHQLDGTLQAKPVNFRAGMEISYSIPSAGVHKVKIVEIRQKEDQQGYSITLQNSAVLTEDMLVGAGDNSIMFTFAKLQEISTFTVGKDGKDFAQIIKEKSDQLREEFNGQGE